MPRASAAHRRTQVEDAVQFANRSGSGTRFVSGIDINLQRLNEEYVPALKTWSARMTLYQRMGNDAKIAAILRANIMPMISAVRWKVEGGKDEVKKLVAANLLRDGNPDYWCDTSWTQRVFESMLALQYGISMFGKTREIVDGKMIFRRLTYLHPRSLGGTLGPFEFDDSGTSLVAIHRMYRLPNGEYEPDERIAIEDVFPVVWWMAGENWEGVPLIRSMYRAYTEKDLASKIQMIDLQNRGVGIPKGKLAPNDGPKAAETMTQILKDMRGGSKERAFIIEADGQDIKFLTSEGSTLDAGPILMDKNNELAASGGTDFQQQGQTATGSRATGSVLMVNYMQELEATRIWLQDTFNHGAGYCMGLTEELVDANFGQQEEPTRIVGSCVSPTEQLDHIPNIVDAVQKGALTHDLSLENHVRKSFNMNPITAEEFEQAMARKAASSQPNNIGGRPTEPTPTDVEDPRNDATGRAFGLTQKKTLNSGANSSRARGAWPWLRSTTA